MTDLSLSKDKCNCYYGQGAAFCQEGILRDFHIFAGEGNDVGNLGDAETSKKMVEEMLKGIPLKSIPGFTGMSMAQMNTMIEDLRKLV